MKNLKLLENFGYDIEADAFCHDYEGNAYFISNYKIYCLAQGSAELSIYSEIEFEEHQNQAIIGIEYLIQSHALFIASAEKIYLFDLYQKEIKSVCTISGIKEFAWSPDQMFLIALTDANAFYLLTSECDLLTEKSLCPEDFGEGEPITVGWGSKETQFHGSEGKEAAKVKKDEPQPALPYDDCCPRVSWRGDGEYFVTSSIHSTKGYRHLRIWSREAVLQFTSEVKDGLEEPLCWKPSGELIACSQQHANKHKIIFFQKNGLQHGEFVLPFTPKSHKVTNLSWNSDSTVLLIVAQLIENPTEFKVMLWICGNYHWYLKQSFSLPMLDSKKLSAKWSSTSPYELFCLNQTTYNFYHLKWSWTLSRSPCICKDDDAIVASIDNNSVLITPFTNTVIPPPFCAYSFTLPSQVLSVCFAPQSTEFCCYFGHFNLAFFKKETPEDKQSSEDCTLKFVAAGDSSGFKSKVHAYNFKGIFKLSIKDFEVDEFGLSHWTWVKNDSLLCVCSVKQNKLMKSALISFRIPSDLTEEPEIIGSLFASLNHSVVAMCSNAVGNVVAIQLNNGKVYKINFDENKDLSDAPLIPWLCDDGSHLTFPQPCSTMCVISIRGKDYILGLSDRFALYLNNITILTNCTSYYVHDEYLLTTTTDPVLKCFLIDYDLFDFKSFQGQSDIQSQRIEKGAKIIIAPSNTTKVILQMPRGNLETIHPRPLVLSQVCKYLDKLLYNEAFMLSKVHRIDLNILYDHNPKAFLENSTLFVDQLKSDNNINLFLASLKLDDVSETLYSLAYKGKTSPEKLDLITSKIDVICDTIRNTVEAKKDDSLFLTLIATYAKKGGPELEQALIKLKKIKDSGSENSLKMVDSALNFLIYMVDVNDLIDIALGTYDLEITVMVAQKSQKDPKEYLPFYNELHQLEENYKKYKIDMHLRRFKLALEHISKCESNFDECLSLIKNQRLYVDSLYLFPSSSDRWKILWKEYGSYLKEKRYYDEAGLAFMRCEEYEMALLAYKESLNWQSLLCAALKLSYPDDIIVSLCVEMAEKLKSNQKYLDASYLLEQYVKDVEESIVTLIEGCEWNAALLMISKYRRDDITETHLKPALKEHNAYLVSYIEELSNDFKSHVDRLKEVRTQKKKEAEFPDVDKHHDEEMFSETGSVTDVASSVASSKQLSGSIMTRKSSKSRRKQKLKKYRLKEGSANEDLAHIAALSEIVVKIDSLKDNFVNTLKTLVQFSFDAQAQTLQKMMCDLLVFVESQLPEIWRPVQSDLIQTEMKFGPDSTVNSITAFLQSEKSNKNSIRIDPELAQPPWRKIDCGLQMFK